MNGNNKVYIVQDGTLKSDDIIAELKKYGGDDYYNNTADGKGVYFINTNHYNVIGWKDLKDIGELNAQGYIRIYPTTNNSNSDRPINKEQAAEKALENYDIYGRCQDPHQVFTDGFCEGAEWADKRMMLKAEGFFKDFCETFVVRRWLDGRAPSHLDIIEMFRKEMLK